MTLPTSWSCAKPAGWARWQTWCLRCGEIVAPGDPVSFWRTVGDSRLRAVHDVCLPNAQPHERRCARCWSPIRQRQTWRRAGQTRVAAEPPTCPKCEKDPS